MKITKKQKKQILSLLIPIAWQILFLIFSGNIAEEYRVYYESVFYIGIAVYFIVIGSISFESLWNE
ncbi:MAG: hypothetical protein ACYDG2_18235 [Ruminiclostridium sp.]